MNIIIIIYHHLPVTTVIIFLVTIFTSSSYPYALGKIGAQALVAAIQRSSRENRALQVSFINCDCVHDEGNLLVLVFILCGLITTSYLSLIIIIIIIITTIITTIIIIIQVISSVLVVHMVRGD